MALPLSSSRAEHRDELPLISAREGVGRHDVAFVTNPAATPVRPLLESGCADGYHEIVLTDGALHERRDLVAGRECQRSSVTSTPSALSRVASCLTHSLCASSSQEYEMKVLGTVGSGSGVAMVSFFMVAIARLTGVIDESVRPFLITSNPTL